MACVWEKLPSYISVSMQLTERKWQVHHQMESEFGRSKQLTVDLSVVTLRESDVEALMHDNFWGGRGREG